MSTSPRDRAVVLGRSIDCVLAARVLADEYGAVTVVEGGLAEWLVRLAPAAAA